MNWWHYTSSVWRRATSRLFRKLLRLLILSPLFLNNGLSLKILKLMSSGSFVVVWYNTAFLQHCAFALLMVWPIQKVVKPQSDDEAAVLDLMASERPD